MRKWTRSVGLLFFAAASVYYGPVVFAGGDGSDRSSDSSTSVKLIGDAEPAANAADSSSAASNSPSKLVSGEAGTFSLQIGNEDSIIHVLRIIGDEAQLSIIPSRQVQGNVPAMDLNNVTVSQALDAILDTNGMVWKQKGNLVFVYTKKELEEREKAERQALTRTFTLHYLPAADALALIKPALSADAIASSTKDATTGIDTGDVSGDTGTSSGGVPTGGNSESGADILVVRDYPDSLDQVAKILKEADVRPKQILVEATIFEATLNDNNSLGIDFSLMGGVNFDQLMESGTPLTSALASTILNSVTTSTGTTVAGTPTPASIVGQGYAGGTTGNYDTQVPPGGLQIGIIHNNLGVFISALESATDATVLANPKVLVLNKQAGEVQVGQQLGYQTTTVTSTTSTQTVQFLNTGTILSFRPFIGDDGFIRMEIHPEDSSGSVTNNLPDKTTTQVTSNVMIKDGNTIVIGGLFRENSQTSRNQVPILGDLPLIGALFRSKTDSTVRQEVIILLTPHIIKDDSEFSAASEDLLKQADKMRVGVRKGMMWYGRERLAETAYENAVAEMNKPHPNVNVALWHLNCAINLNPHFLEAIDLKEKITGKVVTDVDNSAIRDFVRDQIIEDTEVPPATQPATKPDDQADAPRKNNIAVASGH